VDRATLNDILQLISVDRAASALFAPTGLLPPEALEDTVPHEVFAGAIPANEVFVSRIESGEPVGFTLTSQRGNGLYLDQISVHPDHGKRGIGRALVETVIADAKDRGLSRVTLSTFRDVAWNGPFYKKLGFSELPRNRFDDFMFEIEDAQRPLMDVTKRCFMERRVRKPIFRVRKGS
tara:strand:- start:76 stop:609 length:534 start_codon:yes stop_codon:yes gene_type:complete